MMSSSSPVDSGKRQSWITDGFAQYTDPADKGLLWHLEFHLTNALKERQKKIFPEGRNLSCTL